jgi:4-amino-4-deoxy-L-arabinose transferase-like glycosyltransferase
MMLLAAIVVWAGFLRLWDCDSSLAGLQIDEASNAWNAYCLLKTGQDEWGQRWPVTATRAFDDYRSPLYLYLLMPFQAIGGMTVCTSRLPAALGGVATVVLIWWLGRRLFDDFTGLVAAALLTIAPWHIQHTRWGHEANVGPLLASLALVAMVWGGLPMADCNPRPRVWKSVLAGVVMGIACYGYAALRLFIPATVVLVFIAILPQLSRQVRSRHGLLTLTSLVLAALLAVAPLAWRHLSDPKINFRAVEMRAWSDGDSVFAAAGKVLVRWLEHFNPTTLFVPGQTFAPLASPDGFGWLGWYMLPLLGLGTFWLIVRSRTSVSARVGLALLIGYPVSGLAFSGTDMPHPLHGFPGIAALCLAGAVGAVASTRWLAARRPRLTTWLAGAFALWLVVLHVRFALYFFGPFNDEPAKLHFRHVDLMRACQWLRPRFDSVDAVFITQDNLLIPHANVLVWLNYDPRKWFDEPREYVTGRWPYFNRTVCTKFGKVRIMYGFEEADRDLETLRSNGREDRAVMILRPRQASMAGASVPSLVVGPPDAPLLLVYELKL